MAQVRSIHTDKRKTSQRTRAAYVEGAAVRKLEPKREDRRKRHEEPVRRRAYREEEQHLGFGYTLFLAAACALTLWMCVGYLELQADNTSRAKNIASLETQLSELQDENNDAYNRVVTSVDLEEIRRIAVDELGMVYASKDQVILYDSEGSDYVKQYAEIPEEKSTFQQILSTVSR